MHRICVGFCVGRCNTFCVVDEDLNLRVEDKLTVRPVGLAYDLGTMLDLRSPEVLVLGPELDTLVTGTLGDDDDVKIPININYNLMNPYRACYIDKKIGSAK